MATNKEFLLKFARDRRRWLQWFFEAKKRYGLSVLMSSGNPQQLTRAFWGMKMSV